MRLTDHQKSIKKKYTHTRRATWNFTKKLPMKNSNNASFDKNIGWKGNRKPREEWAGKAGIGPVAQFAYSFSHAYYTSTVYTHVIRVANRNSISGRCVEKWYREVRDFEAGMNIQNVSRTHTYVSTTSLSLPPPSRPLVAYVVHRLKPNSTATVLKGFFFSFLHVANLPYAGRNKRQCTASPLSACKGVRVSIGAKLRAFCTRNVTCGFFKSTRNSAIMNKGKTRERENCIDISICVNYARERERRIISKRPRNFCCDGMGIVIDRIYKRSRNLYVLRCQLLED